MGLGLLRRQLGLEDLPGINPWPRAHISTNNAECNTSTYDPGANDPGTDTDATIPAGSDAIVRELLELV